MSVQLPPYRPVKRRSGIAVMMAAFHALLMRELQTRFGSYRLGYLWAPLEVILQMAIMLVIFGAVMKRVLPGMDYMLFLVSGFTPFFMMQKIATRSLGAVAANQGLLMYRAVRHIDVIIARSFLELVIYFITFVILIVGLSMFGIGFSMAHLDVVLLCWVAMFFFAFGLALIFMIIGHYGGEISKVISILFTVLYFTSGVLYSVHIVPEPYLSYLMYNPFIHNLEMIRHALSPTYPIYHVSMSYFLAWTACVNFLGLLLYKACERDLIRSK
ncbi:polysialic acid transporter [Moraxella caviae]|uniref:Transport permease protein n=1 Tax=Moraxella caviae TaxID=34060 RepID=A0A1S9ZY91_9GAMM|nr:ABC transporter permease [Moraxella caviae]OOR88368.1 polysialic acid transporter [Moraxella caviae]STZ10604.1 Polysialic acid transport protein kpsM [Moraxella caviae]VEW13116.1 Polysialic acid transport protein kpsM [Moraxella caviae]